MSDLICDLAVATGRQPGSSMIAVSSHARPIADKKLNALRGLKGSVQKCFRQSRRISLTPCFSGVFERCSSLIRFNGFDRVGETVETVLPLSWPPITQLKRGVNEMRTRRARRVVSYLVKGLETGLAPFSDFTLLTFLTI